MNPSDTPAAETPPSIFNYVLSFLLVGVAWGFTTPFIRRAAVDFNARNEQKAQKEQDAASSSSLSSWVMQKLLSLSRAAAKLLRTPGYTVPLLLNLTGSVWFFLLVGKHGMYSLCYLYMIYICMYVCIFSPETLF